MPLPFLQCTEDCEFLPTLKWNTEGGKFVCSQFPKGIPDYVEDGSKDCPEFKEA